MPSWFPVVIVFLSLSKKKKPKMCNFALLSRYLLYVRKYFYQIVCLRLKSCLRPTMKENNITSKASNNCKETPKCVFKLKSCLRLTNDRVIRNYFRQWYWFPTDKALAFLLDMVNYSIIACLNSVFHKKIRWNKNLIDYVGLYLKQIIAFPPTLNQITTQPITPLNRSNNGVD